MKRTGIFRALLDLTRYRRRLLEGVLHDVRQQYTGSIFGTFWVALFPILQLAIYAGLYTFIFKVRPPGLASKDYSLLVFSGLVPLMAFSQGVVAATASLTTNKNLLLNTVFPAELIPVRAFLSAHAPTLFGLIITVAMGFILGRTTIYTAFLIPVFWVLILLLGIGIGWVLSLLSLVARDIQHSMSLILMLLTMLSPFAYTPEMVPHSLKFAIYLNPMTCFVLSFQRLIVYGSLPELIPALGSFALAFGIFLAGFAIFRRAKFIFFDYA